MNSIFKALNDETRRQIIELLKEGDMNAGEIAEKYMSRKGSSSSVYFLSRLFPDKEVEEKRTL